MKAIVTDGDGSIRCINVREPVLGACDCLVKIRSCLFCKTTDRHIVEQSFDFGLSYPCILGHESIGEVVETGNSVKNFHPGDWVTRPYAVYPGDTLDQFGSGWGGFAELGKIRDYQAMIQDGFAIKSEVPGFFKYMQTIPKTVPLKEAAMITGLREIYSSAAQIPEVNGKSILIAGPGVAGLLFAHFLHLRGAANIAIAARRVEAREFALAETPATVAKSFSEFRNERFDPAIDTTGSREIVQWITSSHLAPHASMFSYAIYPESDMPTSFNNYALTRIDPVEADAHEPICQLLAEGRLKTSHWITKHFRPDDAGEAWRSLTDKNCIKTAIIFDANSPIG